MNDSFKNLISILNQKSSFVFSIALGLLLYWLSLPYLFSIKGIQNLCASLEDKSSTLFIFFSTLTIFFFIVATQAIINLCFWLKDYCKKNNEVKKKQKRILSHLNESISDQEIRLLKKIRDTGRKTFINGETSNGVFQLRNKGIVIQHNFISRDEYEYEIPDFVWNSEELKSLISQFQKKSASKS